MKAKETSALILPEYRFGDGFEPDPTSARTNFYFLIALFAAFTVGMAISYTRAATLLILDENNVVEILTFVAFLIGGGIGLYFGYRLIREERDYFAAGFYLLFAVGMILIGMEEISWGQQFFHFATPESFRAINDQGETTLHNIHGMSGHTEYLRLIYGIGGAIGVLLLQNGIFRKIAAPRFILPWFVLIAMHATVDVFNDLVPIEKHFDAVISELAELVEMLIGFSALIYICFKLKKFSLEVGQKEKGTVYGKTDIETPGTG